MTPENQFQPERSTSRPVTAPPDPRTPGKETEEKRDPHLTYPADPPEGFDASGALIDKTAHAAVMAERKAILEPSEDRPSFEQIEAERAREQGK